MRRTLGTWALLFSLGPLAFCNNDSSIGSIDPIGPGADMHGGGDLAGMVTPPAAPCTVPPEAAPADISSPTTVVGTGTAASCTEAALSAAVALGGIITFNCGASPVTIKVTQQLRINNVGSANKLGDTVLDGGGKVTLDGGSASRILYLNACEMPYNSAMCNNFDHPRLVVQNLSFINGKVSDPQKGGGAIYLNGGTLKVINSNFFNNQCITNGQDVGGGAIATYLQSKPVYIVGSTFGGASGQGNSCSNGGALSSIGTSYTIINSTITGNRAVGTGGNPGNGGNGGGIANDGNTYTLSLCGVTLSNNTANAIGGGAFYVSNNGTGTTTVNNSTVTGNVAMQGGGFYIQGTRATVSNTTVAKNSGYGAGINEYPNAGNGSLDLTNVTLNGQEKGAALEIDNSITGTVTNCTIAGNPTGIGAGSGLKLTNTVLVNNATASCTKTHPSGGGNLQFPGGSAMACVTGITFADALLGPLQDNGGPVSALTMAPGAGSPALHAGQSCPATDERGQTRPATGCTSGAFEVP